MIQMQIHGFAIQIQGYTISLNDSCNLVKYSFNFNLGKLPILLIFNNLLYLILTWDCCICCNPANGRVDFEEWSAYKIQLHGIEWICKLVRRLRPKSKKKKKFAMKWSDWKQKQIKKKQFAMKWSDRKQKKDNKNKTICCDLIGNKNSLYL